MDADLSDLHPSMRERMMADSRYMATQSEQQIRRYRSDPFDNSKDRRPVATPPANRRNKK